MTFIDELLGAVATGALLIGTSMIDVSDPVIVTAGGAILAALSGAVKVLWDRNNALSKATDVALSKCEDEHRRAAENYEKDRKLSADNINVLIQQVISLSSEVGILKGRIQGFQEATDKVEANSRMHSTAERD